MPDNDTSQSIATYPEVAYWLALKFIPRLSVQKKLALVELYGLKTLFLAPPKQDVSTLTDKQYQALIQPNWQKIKQIISDVAACHSHIIGFDDTNYPSLLKQLYDPPLVLFVKGDVNCLVMPQVAIVGSRNASIHGQENAYSFAEQLAQRGVVICSGLALGVDAFAHKGAIAGQYKTVAVMATGIDKIYPTRHKKLAQDIVATGGALITEFLPGTVPKAGHFPKRNRIISGLSLGVLVVEATLKSGSLITARCALEQNREVFALPGNIHNAQASGCHWLIKQGAKLVEDIADIETELQLPDKSGLNLNTPTTKGEDIKNNCTQGLCNDPLLASVGYEITPIDTVVSRSELPTEVVITRLTMLELRGFIAAVPGGYLKLNRG